MFRLNQSFNSKLIFDDQVQILTVNLILSYSYNCFKTLR